MSINALFIDFNSYFASVEQQLDPALRHRPVAVVPVLAETTSCIAASYEAKAMGVKTGTRVWEAREKCPDIIFVEAQHVKYVKLHHKLVKIVHSCVPVQEVRSIDEMWCELMGSERHTDNALALAHKIKSTIQTQAGAYLGSSIGLAPNWFLAKIASNMQKPNGLTVLDQHNLTERMYALALSDIYGIGSRTEIRMRRMGIHTVEDLYNTSKMKLRNVYNSVQGERLYDLLRGRSVYTPPTQRASISHSHVLPPHLRTMDSAFAVVNRLLQKAAMRLRKMEYCTNELTLSVRFRPQGKFKQTVRMAATDDTRQMIHTLQSLQTICEQYYQSHSNANNEHAEDAFVPSAVGIVLSSLMPSSQASGDLFAEQKPEKGQALNQAIDQLNTRFGKNTVWYGGATKALDEAPMRIAFTRIPDVTTEQ